MTIKSDLMHNKCIQNCEEYFMDRMIHLVDQHKIDDANSIHKEFVIQEEGVPEEWMFMNDLTDV